MMIAVVIWVSAPYNRTVLMFVLKIVTFMLVKDCFRSHLLTNCGNEILIFPILDFASASANFYATNELWL